MNRIIRLLLLVVLSLLPLWPAAAYAAPAAAPATAPKAKAPTYRVYATREGLVGHRTANGHVIRPRDRFVALPSWSVLSPRGTDEFQVRVTYKGRSVVLPVWDVGPWNTRDDYWSPNRRYGDLPVGMPMAYAAKRNGYNNGRDEFGRRVGLPNGIDIADGAFWDDLGMTTWDYVEVTFLWLGEDPGIPSGTQQIVAPVAKAPAPTPPPEIEPGATAVDNNGDGYQSVGDEANQDGCGVGGRYAYRPATGDPAHATSSASWKPGIAQAGTYEVKAYVPTCGPQATNAARYKINHTGAITERIIDQQALAGSWVSLGIYQMEAGATIELSNAGGEAGRAVRFDAIKIMPRPDSSPPQAQIRSAEPRADGALLVRWDGSDDASGIASYDVQVRVIPDGGWTPWLSATTATEAAFVPPGPGSYGFRARARDWLGNEQPWREEPDLAATIGG